MTLDFKPEGLADCFKTGDMWGQVLVIKKLGSELTDQALSDITELPIPLNVTWFAQPMDKAAAVAFTRQRLAWIDKEIIEEQRSAVQKGYDFSILPQELKRDACAISAAHLDSPNTEIPDGKNMERE